MKLQRRVSLLAAVLLIGCKDATWSVQPGLDGKWTHDSGIPGSSLQFTLARNGTAVSGSGTWTGEACCSGTVTVTGTVTGDVIDLDLAYVVTQGADVGRTFTEHFEGSFISPVSLLGRLTVNGQSTTYGFRKTG